MEMRPHRRIVLPLDVPTPVEAVDLASDLHEHVGVVKVGLQLFTAAGPDILSMGEELGLDVFLDLKLHDIPNTVAGAVRSAVQHKVSFLTVHACGGRNMLKAAADAAGDDVTLLAVTLLTSIDKVALSNELRVRMPQPADPGIHDGDEVRYHVLHMAKMAWDCGIRGFVCSPLEVKALRDELGPEAVLVVSGVRPAGSGTQDQARVATPKEAMEAGASYLVIGRPITQAEDRVKAARTIAEEIRPYT